MRPFFMFAHFNSIKVQLEQKVQSDCLCLQRNFNSIKVQLEQTLLTSDDNLFVFQFHKGTIRTCGSSVMSRLQSYFNSIKVQLELPALIGSSACKFLFQFHKGTIRTWLFSFCFLNANISIP